MTFSDTVAQQREQQEKNLKRFMIYSLAGSFALHGVGLCLKVNHLWQPNQAEPEDIAIVVTQPSDEELAEVIPEENIPEPAGEPGSGTAGGGSEGGGSGAAGAATILDAPPAPQASEPAEAEDRLAEEEPEPPPASVPIVGDVEEPLTGPSAEANAEATETAPEPRNLSNLLEDLRRARERTGAGEGSGSSTTAVGPIGPGSGSGSSSGTGNGTGSGSGNGPGNGTGSGSGSGPGNGTGNGTGYEPGTGSGTGAGTGNQPGQGSGSREITCRDCEFDYPESADGAEGTAQVVVETDEQGQVTSVTLSGSSGNPELDRAALEQARERVQLEGARAGESYPIEIDFVQPNSAAAERAEERGDRRSITVSEPESAPDPVASEAPETPSPETRSPALEQPLEQLEQPSEPAVTATPSVAPESSPSPSGSEQIDNPDLSQPAAEPNSPLDTPPPPEATDLLDFEPELIPESNLEPASEPEFAPEPIPEAVAPEPVPEAELTPAPEPVFEPVPTPEE